MGTIFVCAQVPGGLAGLDRCRIIVLVEQSGTGMAEASRDAQIQWRPMALQSSWIHHWTGIPRGQQGSGCPCGNRSCPLQPGLPGDARPALKHQAGRDHPNIMVAPVSMVGTVSPGHGLAGTTLGGSQLPGRDCSFPEQQNDLWREQIHELLGWEMRQSAQQHG